MSNMNNNKRSFGTTTPYMNKRMRLSKHNNKKMIVILLSLFMIFGAYPANAASDTIRILDSNFDVVKKITNDAEINNINLIIQKAQKSPANSARRPKFSHKISIKYTTWLYDVRSGDLVRLTKAKTPTYFVSGDDYCVLYYHIYPGTNTCPQGSANIR